MSLYSFSASHPACWHCLGGFEPQCHCTPFFRPPSPLKPHHTAQLPSPKSCFSLPSPILLTLHPAPYSQLIPHGAQVLSKSHHTTSDSWCKPSTATHHCFEGFLYSAESRDLCPPHLVRPWASRAESSIGTEPGKTVLTHSQPLPAMSSLVETACVQYKWISLISNHLNHLKNQRSLTEGEKKGKEKGEWRQEIKEIEQTRWFSLEAAFWGATSFPWCPSLTWSH